MVEMNTAPIITREERRQQFIESGWWVSIPLATIPAHWLYQGENRLDGGYYTAEANAAFRAVNDCGFEVQVLEKVTAPIWYPGRFKRIYAKSPTDGTPFLTASEMLQFRPTSTEYLANNTSAVDICKVQNGWILVTRSGTVGRCVIVGKRLGKFAITDDAIRVQAKGVPVGYLYAYLSSWIGQVLISKDQYGSAIKHLEPHHLANVPVPLPPEEIQAEIHAEIMRAYALRDEANELLDEADRLLHEKLGLPVFDESLVPYLPAPSAPCLPTNRPEMPHPKAFSIRASELADRFDASFHVPIARTAVKLLRDGLYEPVQLGSIADDIIVAPRFKRIYVPKEYGVPFLQGSHLPQMRPYDLKYLSRTKQTNLERWIIHKGWVLVTCSGTIGRVGLVSSYMDKWAASQHLLRIVPDYHQGHPGYIAAFLMTPYGQHQLTAKIYGGVVDELTEEDTRAVWIPNAPLEIQREIGERVVQAFEKKDEASAIEEAAIRKVENLLQKREAA
ncbi:restriction endonuclease subunit S [Thermanaerothrix sp. 4228-RoL]|uniref:Restriction endonuclease subunit S n=1 Tax=Thermanaerothrix solaris TaxID=3058434 RepID=A0ABU3NN35_9CHLR|nr:restriction endonuclease subunit S [Thermanaerothrix sp. 4228-RoL]MDT8898261.1 restriction endonuclease subunit S [Thermanaerothrix sp. 4228-RoL]